MLVPHRYGYWPAVYQGDHLARSPSIFTVCGGGGHHTLGRGGQSHHVSAALSLGGGRRQGGRQYEQVVVQSADRVEVGIIPRY